MVRVNLSETDADAFEPFPGGRYPLNVFDGEIRTSGPNATHPDAEYIAWDFTVASGDFDGRHVWDNTSFSHADCDCGDEEKFLKALFKLKGLLAATGKWSPEELDAEEFAFEIDDIVGSVVKAQIRIKKDEEYGDKNEIRKYMAMDAAELASSSTLPS